MAASAQEILIETPLNQDAVLRNLLILEKFIDRISTETKAEIRDLDWRCIGGLRNIITHNHLGATLTRMWGGITCCLPT